MDASSFGEDYDEVFFETDGLERLGVWLSEHGEELPEFPKGERFDSPIARPSKIVCIGLNFDDHAAESGMEIPEEPVLSSRQVLRFADPTMIWSFPEVETRPTGRSNWPSSWANERVTLKRLMLWIISPAMPCTTITVNGPFNWREAGNGSKEKAMTPSLPSVPS